jgi:NIMA (never in mitosis gene a)-related kinase
MFPLNNYYKLDNFSNLNSNMDNYEKLSDIGKGSFGVVSKIKRKSDGRVLVWKELNYGKMNDKEKQ